MRGRRGRRGSGEKMALEDEGDEERGEGPARRCTDDCLGWTSAFGEHWFVLRLFVCGHAFWTIQHIARYTTIELLHFVIREPTALAYHCTREHSATPRICILHKLPCTMLLPEYVPKHESSTIYKPAKPVLTIPAPRFPLPATTTEASSSSTLHPSILPHLLPPPTIDLTPSTPLCNQPQHPTSSLQSLKPPGTKR